MKKSKKEKTTEDEQLRVANVQLMDKEIEENSSIQSFSSSPIVLMPELEELVKKNPNRLIGCGG